MSEIFSFVGGLGLFLLGMSLMTEGLKSLAGNTLKAGLMWGTRTRLRGLFTGFALTAVLQSSSVITVTTIGFVSAGLLSFSSSMWVLFGSNVGTTMTAWLVALVGFKLNIQAFALPLTGLGMALRLTAANSMRGPIGLGLAGFGVLFLGMDFMQSAFSDAQNRIDLSGLTGFGIASIFAFLFAGLILTMLVQSSSASLAIVLTLAHAGVLPISEAAAAVIGANIGSTATALIASIGSTAHAKRSAFAHLGFNVVAGCCALVLMPVLIAVIDVVEHTFGQGQSVSTSLAIFHTLFNLLGVIVIWPLADYMHNRLLTMFESPLADSRSLHLDSTVPPVPAIALAALQAECMRMHRLLYAELEQVLANSANGQTPAIHISEYRQLLNSIQNYAGQIKLQQGGAVQAESLSAVIRVVRAYDSALEYFEQLSGLGGTFVSLQESRDWLNAVLSQVKTRSFDSNQYEIIRESLVQKTSRGECTVEEFASALKGLSLVHRLAEQMNKAQRFLTVSD